MSKALKTSERYYLGEHVLHLVTSLFLTDERNKRLFVHRSFSLI